MRHSKMIAGAALFAACAAICPAWAQRTAAPEQPRNARFGDPTVFAMNYQDYFYGVVSKIQPDALVLVKTKVGVPQTVELTRKTKYIRDGKRSALAQLKVGEMVYIDLKTNKKTGEMLARKVVSGMSATTSP